MKDSWHEWVDTLPDTAIEVRVGPPDDYADYTAYVGDVRVDSIIKERRQAGVVSFQVRFRNGDKDEVSLNLFHLLFALLCQTRARRSFYYRMIHSDLRLLQHEAVSPLSFLILGGTTHPPSLTLPCTHAILTANRSPLTNLSPYLVALLRSKHLTPVTLCSRLLAVANLA